MAADRLAFRLDDIQEPRHATAITPNDGTDLVNVSRCLLAATAGVVKVNTIGGESGVTLFLPAGFPVQIRASRVWASGTTATGIVALD